RTAARARRGLPIAYPPRGRETLRGGRRLACHRAALSDAARAGGADPEHRIPPRGTAPPAARRLPPTRPADGLPDPAPDPRWRMGAREQERAGFAADVAPGVARMGVRQRRLPPEPARDVSGSTDRPEACAALDPRGRPGLRHRSGLRRGDRRVGGGAPGGGPRAHPGRARVPAPRPARRPPRARPRGLFTRLPPHPPPSALG